MTYSTNFDLQHAEICTAVYNLWILRAVGVNKIRLFILLLGDYVICDLFYSSNVSTRCIYAILNQLNIYYKTFSMCISSSYDFVKLRHYVGHDNKQ